MTSIADLLDAFFVDAEKVIRALGDTFTAHAFVRKVAQKREQIYVDLLHAHRDESSPFIATHQAIDSRLKSLTPQFDIYPMEEATLDTDMFGKVAKSTLYQRLAK